MINLKTNVKRLTEYIEEIKLRLYLYCFWLPTTVSGSSMIAAKSAPHMLGFFLMIVSVFGLCDGICRFKEALRLKRCRLTDRHFRLFRHSMCQRNMIIGLAGRKAAVYYQKIGYRWYHMLPDILLKNPVRFFSPSLLRKNFWPL